MGKSLEDTIKSEAFMYKMHKISWPGKFIYIIVAIDIILKSKTKTLTKLNIYWQRKFWAKQIPKIGYILRCPQDLF